LFQAFKPAITIHSRQILSLLPLLAAANHMFRYCRLQPQKVLIFDLKREEEKIEHFKRLNLQPAFLTRHLTHPSPPNLQSKHYQP